MELRCPVSFSSPSQALSSLSFGYSTENANPSNSPQTAGWPGCYCRIVTRSGILRCLRSNSLSNAILKQSRRLALDSARGKYFVRLSNTGLDKLLSSRLPPAGSFRVASLSKAGLALQQGKSNRRLPPFVCKVKFESEQDVGKVQDPETGLREGGQLARAVGQVSCWVASVVYIGWLFLLPYAPGFNGLTAPVLHPTAEALFNIVLGWTLLFAPLLFTDKKRDRFGGSLEALWIIQMFLTNTVLAPYMAIRQNNSRADRDKASPLSFKFDILSRGMTTGAVTVGIAGALVGLISLLWAFIGRQEAGFGGLDERWEYFLNYVGSERLAYAFLWDIALYTCFQPWLIGDNLDNVKVESRELVRILRFVPYVGLVAYVLGLQVQDRSQGVNND